MIANVQIKESSLAFKENIYCVMVLYISSLILTDMK